MSAGVVPTALLSDPKPDLSRVFNTLTAHKQALGMHTFDKMTFTRTNKLICILKIRTREYLDVATALGQLL